MILEWVVTNALRDFKVVKQLLKTIVIVSSNFELGYLKKKKEERRTKEDFVW